MFIAFNIISSVCAENLIQYNNIEIEEDVINELENSTWVKVMVEIKSRDYTNSVLFSLNNSDFALQEKLVEGNAFSGNITKEGLKKLLDNPNVKTIYLSRTSHILLQEKDINKNGSDFKLGNYLSVKVLLFLIFLFIVIFLITKRNFKKNPG